MADNKYLYTQSATLGGSAAPGLLTIEEQAERISKAILGDGKAEAYEHIDSGLTLVLGFSSMDAAHDFMAAAEGDLVARVLKPGNAQEDRTYANVKATSLSTSIPTRQDTAIGSVRVNARCSFGAGDSYATIVTKASV